MALCEVCRKLDFGTILWPQQKSFPEPTGGWPRGNELYYYEATTFREHVSDNALMPYFSSLDEIKANSSRCELCLLSLACILDTLENIKRSNDLGFRYIPESNYTFWLLGRNNADGFQIIGTHDELRDQYRIMGGAGICVRNECPLSEFIKGRVIAPDPKSPPVQSTIRQWLHACTEKHGHEWSLNKGGPTRLLKVEDNGRMITLDETRPDNVEYAALSYCWGNAQQLTLNNTSVTQLRKGLKTTDLPRTFQDAIWIAYQLGVQYVWVDSLCIFQDNPNDWVQESARMAKVYGNSVITLAANRATSSSEGFLGLRTERNYVTASFVHAQFRGELLIFPLDVKLVADTSRYIRLENEPLSSRGWALQERYLSTRTLHFGSSQISFECQRSFITEDGCSADASLVNWQYRLPNPNQWKAEWQQVVLLYSERELTRKSDKLPAISGIAELFAMISATDITNNASSNRYLAGLWEYNIISDLCWAVDARKRCRGRCYPYRAPSWSWAMLDSAVYFSSVKQPLAVFRDAHVDIDSSGCPYGTLSGGWLLLRGRKYPLRLTNLITGAGLLFLDEGTKLRITVSWDYLEVQGRLSTMTKKGETEQWETAFEVIPLGYDRSIFLIVVRAVKHQIHSLVTIQSFERVGSATFELTGQSSNILENLRLLLQKFGAASRTSDGLEDMLVL